MVEFSGGRVGKNSDLCEFMIRCLTRFKENPLDVNRIGR